MGNPVDRQALWVVQAKLNYVLQGAAIHEGSADLLGKEEAKRGN